MHKNKVLFVVAFEGYQPIEYSIPKHILLQAGYHVITASNNPGVAIAKDGSTTPVDVTLSQVSIKEYAAIIFIGGPGALEHLDNTTSYAMLKKAYESKLIIGAICIATRICAKAGILLGKKATGWNGDNALPQIYDEYGVVYIQKPVIVDENIITATGPSAAQEFGDKIIASLKTIT